MSKISIDFNVKAILILTAAVGVVGSGILFLTYSSLGEQRNALAVLKTELKDMKVVQGELDGGKAKIADLKRQLDHLENGIPPAAYVATLLHELEDYGVKNNVGIIGVQPVFVEATKTTGDEKERKSGYEEQAITVKGRGTYDDALRFVNALKKFPKIVAVKSITLTPKDTTRVKRVSPELEFDITLQAFTFKEEMKTAANLDETKGDVKSES